MTTPHATVTGAAVPYLAGMFVVGSASAVYTGDQAAGSGTFSSIPFFGPHSAPSALAAVGDLMVGVAWIGHQNDAITAPGGWNTVDATNGATGCSCDVIVCTKSMSSADVTAWNGGGDATIASCSMTSATLRYTSVLVRLPAPAVIGAHSINIVPSPPAGVAPTVMIPPDASGSGIPFYYYIEGTDNDEPVPDAGPTQIFSASSQGLVVYGNALGSLHIGRLRLGGA